MICLLFRVRFHQLQRHHRITLLITSISIFVISILTILIGFSGDSAFGQVRFQIVIRAVPQCQNAIDDDGDMLIDYPSDPDCTNASDITE